MMSIPPKALVPFAHVNDVATSIAFYQKLGFTLGNTFTPPSAKEPVWAWLASGGAQLMVAKADEPVVASQQAVLFYIYVDDIPAKHAHPLVVLVGALDGPPFDHPVLVAIADPQLAVAQHPLGVGIPPPELRERGRGDLYAIAGWLCRGDAA